MKKKSLVAARASSPISSLRMEKSGLDGIAIFSLRIYSPIYSSSICASLITMTFLASKSLIAC